MPIQSLLQELRRFAAEFNRKHDEAAIRILGIPYNLEDRGTIEHPLGDGHDLRNVPIDFGGMLDDRHISAFLTLRLHARKQPWHDCYYRHPESRYQYRSIANACLLIFR